MDLKHKCFLLLCLSFYLVNAQVGIGTTTPESSSILDISSTDKGLLIPRMTEAQRNAIVSPVSGLMLYQTNNTPGFYYYNGSEWESVSGAADGDNLGDHTATQNFDMNNYAITAASTISLRPTSATTFSLNRFDTGITSQDQFWVMANGSIVFGILGDGRINARGDILMVNGAEVDKIELSEMMGITGENLGAFTGTTLADDLSVKEALQVLETAVEGLTPPSSIAQEKSPELSITPKFTVSNATALTSEQQNIKFEDIEFDSTSSYSKEEQMYVIPESGTYFFQFEVDLPNLKLNTSPDTLKVEIQKNGNAIATSPIYNNSARITLFKSFKAGDKINPNIQVGNTSLSLTSSTITFSGFKVN